MHILRTLISCSSLVALASANSHAHSGHRHLHGREHNVSGNAWQENSAGDHGLRNVAYYVNWAIYARNHPPQEIPVERLTHINYAFANVRPETGEVYLTDSWADLEKIYSTDSANDTGTNAYGNVNQLFIHKKHHRNLKTILSIGGWTYSPNFAPALSSVSGRTTFAQTAVQILEDIGFDGLDVDWEYPSNEEEADSFVSLLAEIRDLLNKAEMKRSTPTKFYLTIACPAGPQHLSVLKAREMDQYLDFWNLMAYDYAGGFSNTTGHQANLHYNQRNAASTPLNTDDAINFYTSNTATPGKVVLGMPIYGRAFLNTAGPGAPYQGIGDGSFEAGIWDYKALPRPNCDEVFDPVIGASWCYGPGNNGTTGNGTMVTYDTPVMTQQKASYTLERGLGGGMWWETSSDKPAGNGSLIETFLTSIGGYGALKQEQNCLEYPFSKYDNIRAGVSDA